MRCGGRHNARSACLAPEGSTFRTSRQIDVPRNAGAGAWRASRRTRVQNVPLRQRPVRSPESHPDRPAGAALTNAEPAFRTSSTDSWVPPHARRSKPKVRDTNIGVGVIGWVLEGAAAEGTSSPGWSLGGSPDKLRHAVGPGLQPQAAVRTISLVAGRFGAKRVLGDPGGLPGRTAPGGGRFPGQPTVHLVTRVTSTQLEPATHGLGSRHSARLERGVDENAFQRHSRRPRSRSPR
jgi:hypothetical protein